MYMNCKLYILHVYIFKIYYVYIQFFLHKHKHEFCFSTLYFSHNQTFRFFQITRCQCKIVVSLSCRYLSIYLFVHLSIHISINLPIYLSIYLSKFICIQIQIYIYIYIIYIIPRKKFKNDGNQKLKLLFRRIFPLILGWFWPFYFVF